MPGLSSPPPKEFSFHVWFFFHPVFLARVEPLILRAHLCPVVQIVNHARLCVLFRNISFFPFFQRSILPILHLISRSLPAFRLRNDGLILKLRDRFFIFWPLKDPEVHLTPLKQMKTDPTQASCNARSLLSVRGSSLYVSLPFPDICTPLIFPKCTSP